MDQCCQTMTALLKSEVCQLPIDETALQSLSPEQTEALLHLSLAHDLAHAVGSALSKRGLLTDGTPVAEKFRKQTYLSIFRYEKLRFTYASLCDALEQAQVDFVPLKGSVLRAYYPDPKMRTSCDIDVLVKESDFQRAESLLLQSMQYRPKSRTAHDVSFFAPNGVSVELHFDLIEDKRANRAAEVLRGVWDRLKPVQGCRHHMEMTDEAFYFYHIAHMAKHFETGGCGVRPFLDLWMLEYRAPHEKKRRDTLLSQGGLLAFANTCRNLCEIWFGEGKHDALSLQLQHFILTGGVYGNQENHVAVQRGRHGGRLKSLFSRIFLPYSVMKNHFPILQKHRWLLPVMYLRRILRPLFDGRARRYLREWKLNRSVSKAQSDTTRDFLNHIGL